MNDLAAEGSLPVGQRLFAALSGRSLQVHYQPIVAAGSRRVLMVEALARLPGDAGSWVSPEVFVPLAERHGCVEELFVQVAGMALCQVRGWRTAGHDVRLALNVSRLQLLDPRFPRRVARMVRRSGLIPEHVVLEVTESHPASAWPVEMVSLRELREYGFPLALDDFGAGHACHARLADCTWSIVKTDRSLAAGLTGAGKPRDTLGDLLDLARDLGMQTVVEGIEDGAAAALVESLGATALQGFHLGPPRPADDCPAMFAGGPAWPCRR